ncbi:hypothetical protein [Burkholderia sp. SIMBA_062]|uniref:hypothetical protein n=1 Tax=Burkholderia sp. SIMBA_062 TaxID=3085803 RepID=UPI00397B42CF
MKRYQAINVGRVTAVAGDPLLAPDAPATEPKKSAFLVFYRIKHNAGFLYGEGDDPRGYGGTIALAEAARFKTAKQARDMGAAYLRMCRADPESSSATVLKEV